MKGQISQYRKSDHEISDIFINRWSPRAMSGEEVSESELMTLFESARWAPSSYNNQPWRFIYARKGTENWETFYNLLAEPNKVWVKNAYVLIVIASKDTFDYNGKPDRTHSYDAGAAWENFALQGSELDLVVHGMSGFDYKRASKELGIPEGYTVEAMAAVGKPGKKEALPENLQKNEFPSGRKSIDDIACEGKFKW